MNGLSSRGIAPQDQSTIKFNNMKMTLEFIRKEPGISRSEIAQRTGMSPTSITRIVAELQEMGLVRETEAVSNGVGRKAVRLELEPERFFCVGVDISDGDFVMCLQNLGGELKAKLSERPAAAGAYISGEDVARILHGMYGRLLARAGVDGDRVAAVGVGAPGTVDAGAGTVVYADLFHWHNVPLGAMLAELFKKPIFVDNEVKCALFGEISLQPDCGDTVLVTFGRGVGGAIQHNGRMLRGESNSAGEIGHVIVDYTDGRLCSCGRRGCLAAFLTEQGILADARQSYPAVRDIDHLMTAFEAGEPWAIPQVERVCRYISIAISNIVCLVNPPSIILGGKLLTRYPFLFDISVSRYDNLRYLPLRSTVFRRSILKDNAFCRGGAFMAAERYTTMLLLGGTSRAQPRAVWS